MSAPATSARHPWEMLLEQLTGVMPVAHGFGVEDDAKLAAPDRMIWIPGAASFEPAPFSVANAEIVELLAVPHDVAVYGASPTDVFQRARDLDGWLDVLLGPKQGTPPDDDGALASAKPGWAIAGGKPGLVGGDAGASLWRLPLVVTLKDFVVRRYLPTAPITSATVQVNAGDANGVEQAIPTLAGAP